jgi:hypothetical protein
MNRLFEAIANDEVLSARGAELGITWRKVSQYLSLFCFLLPIYWLCISHYVRFIDAEPPNGYGPGDLMKPLVGTCLISAFPFGVLAYRQDLAPQRCRWSHYGCRDGSVYWPFVPI